MYCTSCNIVPGRECSDCHSLMVVCWSSTGPHTWYLWNLERSYFAGLPLLCAGWVRRNQIPWDTLIFRHTAMWGQLLTSRFDFQACQRKQSNTMYGPMCDREQSDVAVRSFYEVWSADHQLIFYQCYVVDVYRVHVFALSYHFYCKVDFEVTICNSWERETQSQATPLLIACHWLNKQVSFSVILVQVSQSKCQHWGSHILSYVFTS